MLLCCFSNSSRNKRPLFLFPSSQTLAGCRITTKLQLFWTFGRCHVSTFSSMNGLFFFPSFFSVLSFGSTSSPSSPRTLLKSYDDDEERHALRSWGGGGVGGYYCEQVAFNFRSSFAARLVEMPGILQIPAAPPERRQVRTRPAGPTTRLSSFSPRPSPRSAL